MGYAEVEKGRGKLVRGQVEKGAARKSASSVFQVGAKGGG
jgi:hypothetical protein